MSGLPCIVSDKITTEVDFVNICWVSIEDEPEIWVNAMRNLSYMTDEQRKIYQKEHAHQIARHNINNTVTILENIYIEQLKKAKKRC